MNQPKQAKFSKTGEVMHFSVGAILKRGDKFLLIDRVKPPFGFAAIAGHIDEGEEAEGALKRELFEESGLKLTTKKLIFEETLTWNTCSRNVPIHHWKVFECEAEGEIEDNKAEVKSIKWYSLEEIKSLPLEPVWNYWFKKLGIL